MSLVHMAEMLHHAYENHYAVGAFDVVSLPSLRITFYKSPPEGMMVYPAEGMSVFSQEAGDLMDGFDPESMVLDAEGIEPACKLFYQHLKQAN